MPKIKDLLGKQADALPIMKPLPSPPKRINLSAVDCKALCGLCGLEYLDGYETRVLEYIISNETPDRYGDIVRASGIDLSNYKREPVIHLSHDTHKFPVANSIKVWYDSQAKAVKAWALFADDRVDRTGLSDTAFRFCSSGFMKGASVGFLPRDSYTPKSEEEREEIGLGEQGREYKECELLEWSVCSVPCNPDALTQMSRTIKSTGSLIEEMEKHNCRYCKHDHKCGCGKNKSDSADELKAGTKIEREHKKTVDKIRASVKDGKITLTDEEIFALIAKDHLAEIPDYYTRLAAMEDEAGEKSIEGAIGKPGYDETENEIRYRVKDPSLFEADSFRRITIKKDKPRVFAIIGKLKGESSTTLQAYRFPKEDGWTVEKAKKWVSSHKTMEGGMEFDFDGLKKDMHDKLDAINAAIVGHKDESAGHHKVHKELAEAHKELSEAVHGKVKELEEELAIHKARLEELTEAHKAHKELSEAIHGKIKELCEKMDEMGEDNENEGEGGEGGEDDGTGNGSKSFYKTVLQGIKGFKENINNKE